ncbi:gamma-glutamylcyclotransferase family protein [Variovorax sp. J22R24]|uniref:gamma-glutamylcyclotransferase family protein n=1 Tax=Variovorax gracilis TaxID=3053502 RepID=UPI0025775DB3|nr:gamma-glutamylcyclotransferase family protein [Variovorax sp. J22R24]MDM0105820.1 gamma-glutamylcyclotransferase family protein [Variovorax sp. J22R24]
MPQYAATSRYVFVYGTLRRGGRNDIARFHPKPEHVADARIAGTLYDLGAYPGAVLGGPSEVFGEIYRIAPELEKQLDELEEVKPDDSGEYIKREVLVESDAGGERLACLVYEIHPDRVRGRSVISGGDWLGAR